MSKSTIGSSLLWFYTTILLTVLLAVTTLSYSLDSGPSPSAHPASPQAVTLTPEQQYLLMKLQIERELQDDIITWAQTRFWIVAALSVVIGFFGVRSLVREMLSTELKDAMRAAADASAAAAQGKEAVRDVRAEAAKYGATVEQLSAAAVDVDRKFRELGSRIGAEGTRSVAAADLKVAAIDQQLAELRRMVELLATDSEGTKRALTEFETRRVKAEQSAASSQAEFDDNSKFNIHVVSHGPGSQTEQSAIRVIDALSKLGFKASSGRWAEGTAVGENIRIAYRAAAGAKVEQIRSAIARSVMGGPYEGRRIDMEAKPKPVVGADYDVVIFF